MDADKKEDLLAVGGPRDGEIISVSRHEMLIRTVDQMPFPPHSPVMGRINEATAEVRYTGYQRSVWLSGTAVRHILVPTDQSPEDTLDMLIKGYRPCRP